MPKTRVLIVDDDLALSHSLKNGLEQSGAYQVRVENNPKNARRIALEFDPAILLLDVIMPEKDGGMVAAEIHEDPALAKVPVIFLTSIVGKNEVAAMGGKTGQHPVLAKPVTLAELIPLIEKTLKTGG